MHLYCLTIFLSLLLVFTEPYSLLFTELLLLALLWRFFSYAGSVKQCTSRGGANATNMTLFVSPLRLILLEVLSGYSPAEPAEQRFLLPSSASFLNS